MKGGSIKERLSGGGPRCRCAWVYSLLMRVMAVIITGVTVTMEEATEATTEAMEAIMTNQISLMNQVMAILMDMSISIVSTFYIFKD